MTTPAPSYRRLMVIYERQWRFRLCGDRPYEAAIYADKTEAPGISTPQIIKDPRLRNQPLHALSTAEAVAVLLALHNPRVFWISTQFVIFPVTHPHPLTGHPRFMPSEQQRPPRGSLEVTEEMGTDSRHPRVRSPEGRPYAFPYIGDLLLFLEDTGGPFAVDWFVKDKYQDFKQRGRAEPEGRRDQLFKVDLPRFVLEEKVFRPAGIPCRPVSRDQIPAALQFNLQRCFAQHARARPLDAVQREEAVSLLQEIAGTGEPIMHAVRRIGTRAHLDPQRVEHLLLEAMWRREVRADLFQVILNDKPLPAERVDVLDRYAAWFSRGM